MKADLYPAIINLTGNDMNVLDFENRNFTGILPKKNTSKHKMDVDKNKSKILFITSFPPR